ncbi:MAG TPA: hypothetical protein VIJ39_13440 [Solirubrobacteraceae bacterium]
MNPKSRTPSRGSRTLALLALAAAALGIVALAGIDPNALCLLPALALAAPLLLRRYPGERMLVGIRGTRHLRWPRPRSSVPLAARTLAVAVHGGLLIARSLAVRPPPAPHPAS